MEILFVGFYNLSLQFKSQYSHSLLKHKASLKPGSEIELSKANTVRFNDLAVFAVAAWFIKFYTDNCNKLLFRLYSGFYLILFSSRTARD